MNESANKPIIFTMFVIGIILNFLMFPLFAVQEVYSLISLFMLSFFWIAFGALLVNFTRTEKEG